MKRITKLLIVGLSFLVISNVAMAEEGETQSVDTTKVSEVKRPKHHHKYNRDDYGDWRFRLGGYGEMLFQHFDYGANRFYENGALKDNRSEISIPRFVLALDFKLSPTWILGSEIEFEYGGTGSGIEYEYEEAGEYEMEVEKGGEVALEQFHITKVFAPWLNLQFGHIIVPVGLTNTHHEPLFFFATTRSEGESALIPCTWHENGIALFGSVRKFDYNIMCVNGLDPNFFSRPNFIRKGRQSMFETSTMTNPAMAARMDFRFIKNTRLGVSTYYAPKTTGNSSKKEKMKDIDVPVFVVSADMQVQNKRFTGRANFLYGRVGDSEALSKLNLTMPKSGKISIFPRDQVAESALDWYAEMGYDLGNLICERLSLTPFVRYEYYNSMHTTEGAVVYDPRFKRDILTVGLNYKPLPNLVIKTDYSHRWVDHGNFNGENTFSLGVGYMAWYTRR